MDLTPAICGDCDQLPQNRQLTFTAAKGNPSEGIIRFTYKANPSCIVSLTYLIKGSINGSIRVLDETQDIAPNTVTSKIDCLRK